MRSDARRSRRRGRLPDRAGARGPGWARATALARRRRARGDDHGAPDHDRRGPDGRRSSCTSERAPAAMPRPSGTSASPRSGACPVRRRPLARRRLAAAAARPGLPLPARVARRRPALGGDRQRSVAGTRPVGRRERPILHLQAARAARRQRRPRRLAGRARRRRLPDRPAARRRSTSTCSRRKVGGWYRRASRRRHRPRGGDPRRRRWRSTAASSWPTIRTPTGRSASASTFARWPARASRRMAQIALAAGRLVGAADHLLAARAARALRLARAPDADRGLPAPWAPDRGAAALPRAPGAARTAPSASSRTSS